MRSKLLLSFIGVLFTSISIAQSVLKVGMTDGTPINISVDGRYFNKRGETVTVNDLPRGSHYVKIYTMTHGWRSERQRIVWQGAVVTTSGIMTLLSYYRFTDRASISDQEMTGGYNASPAGPATSGSTYGTRNDNNQNRNNIENDNRRDYDNNDIYPSKSETESTPLAKPVTIADEEQTADAMEEKKFNKMKKKVANKNTDTEKLTEAKDQLKGEKLTAHQVCLIMDWFGFESTKLEFAEWAYQYTLNKSNYPLVREKLNYQSYRDELDKYLNEHK